MKRLPSNLLIAGLAALGLMVSCFGVEASELRVAIRGVRSSSGSLMVGLYDSEEHFRSALAHAGSLGLVTDRSRLVGIAMRALSLCRTKRWKNLRLAQFQAAATTSRHVFIAAAERCDAFGPM